MLVSELVYSFLIPEIHKQEFRRKGTRAVDSFARSVCGTCYCCTKPVYRTRTRKNAIILYIIQDVRSQCPIRYAALCVSATSRLRSVVIAGMSPWPWYLTVWRSVVIVVVWNQFKISQFIKSCKDDKWHQRSRRTKTANIAKDYVQHITKISPCHSYASSQHTATPLSPYFRYTFEVSKKLRYIFW